jgi:hypothetical protein
MSQNLQNLQNHLLGVGKPANRRLLAAHGCAAATFGFFEVLPFFEGFVIKNDRL